jgi:hypothetical protein
MRKQSFPALTLSAFALTMLLPATLHAEEGHRELGAHVHGHGTLNIAVEDKKISMELEVPGMDVVGFEHAPSTDDQKAKVEEAKEILQRVLDVFALPAAAGCSVTSADVAVEAEHHHDDGDDHDHDAKDEKAGDHDHDEHEGHEGHNQFHATYELACTSPSELSTLAFGYFKHFEGAQGLTVNVVSAKGQSKYEVTRDKPTLDLGGIM